MSGTADKNEKKSNAEEAYSYVLQRLRDGLIGPQERIVDTALATELDMSRMPAREALLRLVNEGYLVGTTRGFARPNLSKEDILEIFEIRKLLEPRAAAAATPRLTPAALDELDAAFAEAQVAAERSDQKALFDANFRFRNAWIQMVPNKRLILTIERFFDQVNAVRLATLHDEESRRISVALLKGLLAAFRRGDSLQVRDLMVDFIEQARLRFVTLVSVTDE